MTTFLSVHQVIGLHDRLKVCAVLDLGKLESAVGQPAATWGGEFLYPTLIQQAGALLYCLCNAHGFEDANKRTAWVACMSFLDVNGVELIELDAHEIVQFMKWVAGEPGIGSPVPGYPEPAIPSVALWLAERT